MYFKLQLFHSTYIIYLIVSIACGLMPLGSLIIETSINNSQTIKVDEHMAKKTKITHECQDDVWIKLAEYVINCI